MWQVSSNWYFLVQMLVVLCVWIMAPYDLGQLFGWLVLCRLNQSNRYISFNLAILVIGANNSIESNLMMCLKCGAGCSNFEWLSIVIWMLKTFFLEILKHKIVSIGSIESSALLLLFSATGSYTYNLPWGMDSSIKLNIQFELTRISKS